MFKISVPKPCHENWEAMSPKDHGRFCNSCEKTVVDFTSMDDESVKNFFLSRINDKVCGRFTGTQLQRIKIELPSNIFELSMPRWKRFLVACLITFSTTIFSCDVSVNGNDEILGEPITNKTELTGAGMDRTLHPNTGFVG